MAVSRIGSPYTNTSTAGATTLAVTISSTPQIGDILVGAFAHATGNTQTTPGGWTNLGNDTTGTTGQIQLSTYWKKSDGTETSVTFTTSATTNALAAVVAVYRGGLDPIGYASTGDNSGTTAITAGNLLNVLGGGACVNFGANANASNTAYTNTTSGTGWSEIADIVAAGAARSRALAVAENLTSTGTVTGSTFTWSATASSHAASVLYIPAQLGSPLFFGSN